VSKKAPERLKNIMSAIQNVSPEDLVKLFHHYQEALASDFDCQPGEDATHSWEETPPNQRKLRIAAARLALLDLADISAQDTPSREYYATQRSGMGLLKLLELSAKSDRDRPNHRYYAKPGEAEWGS
jgi:hypothetical protein